MMNRLNDAALVNVNGGDRKELVELKNAFGIASADTGWLCIADAESVHTCT